MYVDRLRLLRCPSTNKQLKYEDRKDEKATSLRSRNKKKKGQENYKKKPSSAKRHKVGKNWTNNKGELKTVPDSD